MYSFVGGRPPRRRRSFPSAHVLPRTHAGSVAQILEEVKVREIEVTNLKRTISEVTSLPPSLKGRCMPSVRACARVVVNQPVRRARQS